MVVRYIYFLAKVMAEAFSYFWHNFNVLEIPMFYSRRGLDILGCKYNVTFY
jgi:hypothetical protein